MDGVLMEKVGRNDPCPCGSRKKFKKCCEEKQVKRPIGNVQIMTNSTKAASLFHRHIIPKLPEEGAPSESPSL